MATKTFYVSFPEPLAKRLDRQAKREGMNRSELLRSSVRSYLDWIGEWGELSRDLKRRADELDLRTMDDIDRIVHEVRDEMVAEEAARRRTR